MTILLERPVPTQPSVVIKEAHIPKEFILLSVKPKINLVILKYALLLSLFVKPTNIEDVTTILFIGMILAEEEKRRLKIVKQPKFKEPLVSTKENAKEENVFLKERIPPNPLLITPPEENAITIAPFLALLLVGKEKTVKWLK